MSKTKSFCISKEIIWEAWKRIRSNGGSAGIDGVTIESFEEKIGDNLYKLWNRMSSGSYFPAPVKTVSIPKKAGGSRNLGIPTVEDRVAQMAVNLVLLPQVDSSFHENSYGYRPGKSAHDALAITRRRCWKYNWVLEFDIKGLFDNLPQDLLLKGLCHYTKEPWILLYVKRWLGAEICDENGNLSPREKGVPQGGVISPLLSNIFMHFAFDMWMKRTFPHTPICRYADDGLAHARTKDEAEMILKALNERMAEVGLELHPDKTKIVYCKDDDRKGGEKGKSKFTFLGFEFRPRRSRNRNGKHFINFTPAVSRDAIKSMKAEIRNWKLKSRPDKSIFDLSRMFKRIIQGWINYYCKFYKSAMYDLFRYLNTKLINWAMRKYKKLKRHRRRAQGFLAKICKRNPNLFPHWRFLPITIE